IVSRGARHAKRAPMRSTPQVEGKRELWIVRRRRGGVSAGRVPERIEPRRTPALGLEAVLGERVDGAPARVGGVVGAARYGALVPRIDDVEDERGVPARVVSSPSTCHGSIA